MMGFFAARTRARVLADGHCEQALEPVPPSGSCSSHWTPCKTLAKPKRRIAKRSLRPQGPLSQGRPFHQIGYTNGVIAAVATLLEIHRGLMPARHVQAAGSAIKARFRSGAKGGGFHPMTPGRKLGTARDPRGPVLSEQIAQPQCEEPSFAQGQTALPPCSHLECGIDHYQRPTSRRVVHMRARLCFSNRDQGQQAVRTQISPAGGLATIDTGKPCTEPQCNRRGAKTNRRC